jgi:hypothetical protein
MAAGTSMAASISVPTPPEMVASAAGEEVTRSRPRHAYLLLARRPVGLPRYIALLFTSRQAHSATGSIAYRQVAVGLRRSYLLANRRKRLNCEARGLSRNIARSRQVCLDILRCYLLLM